MPVHARSPDQRKNSPGNCPSDIRHLTDVSVTDTDKTVNIRKAEETISRGDTVAADEWHDELVLAAELSSVNNQIARFVLRMLDTDARRREGIAVADECRLGGRLVNLGYALQDRAVHRAAGRLHGGANTAETPCSRGNTRSIAG